MNLTDFNIKNYKGLRQIKVDFSNYTALIGENGSGKTSVLEALFLFFTEFNTIGGTPSAILQEDTSWHNRNYPLEFTAKFVLDDEDCEDLFTEDVLSKIAEEYGDQHKELTISRRVPTPGAPWETMYINIAKVPLVKNNDLVSPEALTRSISKLGPEHPVGEVKAFLFDPNANQSNLVGNRLIVLNDTAYNMDDYTDNLVREGKIPFEHLPGQDYTAWASDQGFNLVNSPPVKENIDSVLSGESQPTSNEILQRFQKKLDEKIKGKFKLIQATRNERIEPGQRTSFLSASTVINPLKSLHGTDDAAWYEIRTVIGRLIGHELDSVPMLSTWERGLHLDVSLIGGGQQEIIGLIYQIHTATESIIAIEEPETHLHHSLARKLFEVLKEAANNKQLIVATHSEYFAEVSAFTKNWSFEKKGKEVKAKEIISQAELLDTFSALGAEPSDRGYPNKILFVAGETEQDILPVWANKLKVKINKLRIECLDGEYGKRKVQVIKNYIEAAQTAVFLIVDSHAKDDVKQLLDDEHRLILQDTIEGCYPIGIITRVLNENFGLDLTEDDIDTEKPRVEEIKRILKDKRSIPRKRTFWKRPIGKEVAKLMSGDEIPEEIREFIMKIAD